MKGSIKKKAKIKKILVPSWDSQPPKKIKKKTLILDRRKNQMNKENTQIRRSKIEGIMP